MMKLLLLAASSLAFSPRMQPTRTGVVLFNEADGQGTFRYDNSDSISPLETKQAMQETANWCLERYIKLGHCEVLEDLNKMSTAQVQDFCKMFQDDAPWAGVEKPVGV